MSDFKLFCEINSEIDTGIYELYADAKCLLKCPDSIIDEMGWSLDKLIKDWEGVTVEDGRITELCLDNNEIGSEGAKGLVLPPGLHTLDLYDNNIGIEGATGLVLPPGLQKLYLENNNIGFKGTKGLKLPAGLQELNLAYNNIGTEGAKAWFYHRDFKFYASVTTISAPRVRKD